MQKIIIILIVPIAILFIASSAFVGNQLDEWIMERVESELFTEATQILNILKITPIDKEIETLDPFIDALADNTSFRLTIIRSDGVVIADSWVATIKMESVKNHAGREELLTAASSNRGTAIRYSTTVNTNMFYLAIPYSMVDFSGFIRVAIPLDTTQSYLSDLQNNFIWTGIFGGLILLIIIILSSKHIDNINAKHNRELERKIEGRTKDISQLQKFGQMLTGCESVEEITEAVLVAAPSIFGDTSGAISLNPPSLDHIEITATWGDDWHERKIYSPNDCWSFRKGSFHVSEQKALGFSCKHFTSNNSVLCAPFIAQGVSLGAIHVMVAKEEFPEPLKNVVLAMAEHLSLSIANVNLRNSLKHQAIRDPLTNLYNRRYLDETLSRELSKSKRIDKCLGVLMIDVDHFKKFNDTYGHEAGDYALQQVSIALANSIRREDIACRYGGEEFTIILTESDISIIAKRAQDILNAVRSLNLQYRGKSLGNISISIGVSIFPTHGKENEELLAAADKALYAAKSAGRDQIKAANLPAALEEIFNANLQVDES